MSKNTEPIEEQQKETQDGETRITPADLNVTANNQATLAELMVAHGYDGLKKTQAYAFEQGILNDGNDLLVAETGNGKTLTAEGVVYKHLKRGDRVAYLVPSTQLVWAKKDAITEWAGDDYRIYSGQNKYKNADVAVATFDSFYQAILKGTEGARSIDAIILDDFHELYTSFRGGGIEKAISAALYGGNGENGENSDVTIYGISATLGNPVELGEWMNADVHISPEGRQTPIKEYAVDSSTASTQQRIIDVIEENADTAPYLVFCFAKSWTESRARAIAEADILEGPSPEIDLRAELSQRVDGLLTETHREILDMLRAGVAYIHSDLPNNVKRFILDLYEEGELQAITTTTSLAYGFDSPVQTVIIADIKRRGQYVGVFEYVQWAGRAARPRFDYPCGHCYVLADDPEEMSERFFEETRELEDVKTHIDDDEQFRWLVLELIANGWESTDEIESFVKETLYWQQMTIGNSWGRGPETKEEKLKLKLESTTEWLVDQEFITEKDTQSAFTPTSLGRGAVDFHYGTFVDAELSSIKSFYNWAEETPHNEITQLDYLHQVIANFGMELGADTVEGRLDPVLHNYGYTTNSVGITAGLIRWYWMGNYSTERIEGDTGIDPTYLPGLASKISTTIQATKYIVEAAPNARAAKWHDNLVFRVEKGVNEDAIPIVSDINAMGRVRIRFLRTYLEKMAHQTLDIDPDVNHPLWTLLSEFYDHAGSSEQFEDLIAEKVPTLGNVTAKSLSNHIQKGEVETTSNSTHEEHALESALNGTSTADVELEEGSTLSTSLGDF